MLKPKPRIEKIEVLNLPPFRRNVSSENRQDRLINDAFLNGLSGWLTPKEVSDYLKISVLTVYSWKAKSQVRKIPDGLFMKFNRKLFVRADVLKTWIESQNQPG